MSVMWKGRNVVLASGSPDAGNCWRRLGWSRRLFPSLAEVYRETGRT